MSRLHEREHVPNDEHRRASRNELMIDDLKVFKKQHGHLNVTPKPRQEPAQFCRVMSILVAYGQFSQKTFIRAYCCTWSIVFVWWSVGLHDTSRTLLLMICKVDKVTTLIKMFPNYLLSWLLLHYGQKRCAYSVDSTQAYSSKHDWNMPPTKRMSETRLDLCIHICVIFLSLPRRWNHNWPWTRA